MEILYLLIPLAVLVAVIMALFFQWSVKNGQFDDLEGPAHAILMDDDAIVEMPTQANGEANNQPVGKASDVDSNS